MIYWHLFKSKREISHLSEKVLEGFQMNDKYSIEMVRDYIMNILIQTLLMRHHMTS